VFNQTLIQTTLQLHSFPPRHRIKFPTAGNLANIYKHHGYSIVNGDS